MRWGWLQRLGLARFTKDERGLAAVEFAAIAPVLAILILGVVELSNFMSAQRRVIEAAHVCADLISQEADVSSADLADMVNASRYVLQPFDDTDLTVGIASVRFDEDSGSAYQDWSYSYNGGTVSNAVSQATDMGDPGDSVIIVEAGFTYRPILSAIFDGLVTIEEVGLARPRALSYVGKY